MKELSVGTNNLKEGMTILNQGIVAFNTDGIGKLSDVRKKASKISDRMERLVELSENYKFFVDSSTDISTNTKFIFVVDGVKAPKTEKKVAKEVKKETIFDRIINLFK